MCALILPGYYLYQSLNTAALHTGDTITVSFWYEGHLTVGLGSTFANVNSGQTWAQESISYQLTANDLSSVTLGFSNGNTAALDDITSSCTIAPTPTATLTPSVTPTATTAPPTLTINGSEDPTITVLSSDTLSIVTTSALIGFFSDSTCTTKTNISYSPMVVPASILELQVGNPLYIAGTDGVQSPATTGSGR